MGKLGKMIGRGEMDTSDDAGNDDNEPDDVKAKDVSEAEKLAMYEFHDAFNSGDMAEAAAAFKKLCDICMEY